MKTLKIRNDEVATYSATKNNIPYGIDPEVDIIAKMGGSNNTDGAEFSEKEIEIMEKFIQKNFPAVKELEIRTSGITGLAINSFYTIPENWEEKLVELAKMVNGIFGEFGGVKRIKKYEDNGYNSCSIYVNREWQRVKGTYDFFKGKFEKK